MNDFTHVFLRSGLAAGALALAALASGPAPAAAPNGASPAPAGEHNVYAAGGQVRTAGAVAGDYVAAGGKVLVDQPVAEDAMLAGGSVDVRGAIGDDLRAVGGDVTIAGKVGGELFAAGGNITVAPTALVAHGAGLYGGNIALDGQVDGDLRASARKLAINGEVRGNAQLAAEEIELGPKAHIAGTLTYASPNALKQAEGATIVGAVTREAEPPGGRNGPDGRWQWERSRRTSPWAGGIVSFLAVLAVAAAFLLLVPRFGTAAARRIQASPWPALGIGLVTAAAVPVLALFLFMTLLGIPLALALLGLFPVMLLGGFVVGVLFIGRQVAVALRKEEPRTVSANLGYFAIALLLTLLVVRVPFLGGLLATLLGLAGIGGCVLELQGRRRGPPAEQAAPQRQRPGSSLAMEDPA